MNQVYKYNEKTCPKCNVEFKPTSGRQKYCSDCGRREKANCIICNKIFDIVNTTGKYCSFECSRKGLYAEWRNPINCPICSKSFSPNREEQITCSIECGNDTRKESTSAKNTKVCPICNNKFVAKHLANVTCSRVCGGFIRRKVSGEPCERCGKPISWKEGGYRLRFCSKECRKLPVGTKRETQQGYVEVLTEGGWKREHRYIVEQDIGRELLQGEMVHHKNGLRNDNRIENLELWYITKSSKKDPAGQRVEELIDYVIMYHKDAVLDRL